MASVPGAVETVEVDKEGNREWSTIYNTKRSMEIDGAWMRVEFEFTVQETTEKLSIFFYKGKHRKAIPIYMDELIIKEEGAKVFRREKGILYYENLRYPISGEGDW